MTDRLPPLPHLRVLASGTIDGKSVELRGWHEDDLDDWFYQVHRMLAELKADRDSWIEQASQRAQETVEAMQQVDAYRMRCAALHSAPREPREPLTDEQVEQCYRAFDWSTVPHPFRGSVGFERGVRFAERAHGIGADAPSKE